LLKSLFDFGISPWELIIRGSLIYWFLFFLFRFILRRDAGSVGLADILVIVLIADAAQNGMAGEYKSVGEAFLLIGTIAAWNYWIDWMSFNYAWFARFAEPGVLPLIRHGRILKGNLRREMLTEDELQSKLRENGVEDVGEVKFAALEPEGNISVIRYSSQTEGARGARKRPGSG
jgi:uncharacterized membrane protein YcaP (DUF421 family)